MIINILPQAPFSPKNNEQIMKHMRILVKTRHFIIKSSCILCRRRLFPPKIRNKSWKYENSCKNINLHNKKLIYTLPQATFSPTNNEKTWKYENSWTNMKFHNKKLIYTLPQAPFSPKSNEQIMNNMRKSASQPVSQSASQPASQQPASQPASPRSAEEGEEEGEDTN